MYELIDIVILFAAIVQQNYCCLVMYVLNITVGLFQYINIIGLAMQGQSWQSITDAKNMIGSRNNLATGVIIALIVYYTVAIILSFYAYRHWKA